MNDFLDRGREDYWLSMDDDNPPRGNPLDFVKYDFRRKRFVTDSDRASGGHNRLFRTLPASFSRLLGALLYRHIA